MPASTLILIVRSLWPFLKEVVLKDKGLRDLVVENKVATFLSGCLLFLFTLFLSTVNLADKNYDDAKRLAQDKSFNLQQITEQKQRIGELEEELKKYRYPDAPAQTSASVEETPPPTSAPETAPPTPQPKRPKTKPARTTDKQKVESSLKSYVESRYQKLGHDGN